MLGTSEGHCRGVGDRENADDLRDDNVTAVAIRVVPELAVPVDRRVGLHALYRADLMTRPRPIERYMALTVTDGGSRINVLAGFMLPRPCVAVYGATTR